MKKLCAVLMVISVILSLSACGGMSVSDKMYQEISGYVTENMESLSPTEEVEFFRYQTDGLSIGSVYYGYYYTAENEYLLPDFYLGSDYDTIKNAVQEADGGIYFGKPNNGTDWCFVRHIADHWYYYELHWA